MASLIMNLCEVLHILLTTPVQELEIFLSKPALGSRSIFLFCSFCLTTSTFLSRVESEGVFVAFLLFIN